MQAGDFVDDGKIGVVLLLDAPRVDDGHVSIRLNRAELVHAVEDDRDGIEEMRFLAAAFDKLPGGGGEAVLRGAVDDPLPMGTVFQNDIAGVDDDVDGRQDGEEIGHDENDLFVSMEDFLRFRAFGEEVFGFQLADVLMELLLFGDEIEERLLFARQNQAMLL